MNGTKTVKHSQASMTQLVLPDETNALGNLLGGQLMHWIDLVAAIAAMRHSRKVCVTASVDEINFIHPVRQGEVVTLRASVNRVFSTSMEVGVSVSAEDLLTGETHHTNSAYLTFVAIDDRGRPIAVDPIQCEDDEEIRRYKQALQRREQRLQRRIK
ncbi:MAG TPA: acyl-CoA thioesterase [Bacteroidota bacterium]|nr:acyl-CoA thioesterase [Bacteroidota bacterium]